MSKVSSKVCRLVAAAVVAGAILPAAAAAKGGKWSGARARQSSSGAAPSVKQFNSPSMKFFPKSTRKSQTLGNPSSLSKPGKLTPIFKAPGQNSSAKSAASLFEQSNATSGKPWNADELKRSTLPFDANKLNAPSGLGSSPQLPLTNPRSGSPFFRGRLLPAADLTPALDGAALGGGNGAGAGGGNAQQGPRIPLPNPREINPAIDLGRIKFPGQIELPGGSAGGPQGGGPANPRIPPQGPVLDPNVDLGRVPIPREIDLPGGAQGNPPGNNPGNNPGDNPGNDPGNDPGDNPGGDPGDNPGDPPPPGEPPPQDPPVVPIPFPIPWPVNPGGGYCPDPYYPVYPGQTVVEEAIPQTSGVVDLLLEDVEYVEAATLLVGPAYRVTFRNQGAAAVGAFRVAILAGMDGRLSEDAPRAIVEVAGLAAGESRTLTIRMPRTAMRLVSTTAGQPGAFTHLFVAVDVDSVIRELDKTNNVAILERALLEQASR